MGVQQTYICLIRGINVSGQKSLKMEALRKALEALGFGNVRTYLQSGNVVFRAGKAPSSILARKIASQIQSEFGYSVSVLLREPSELEAAVRNNPFLKGRGCDTKNLHVTFLAEAPAKDGLKKLQAIESGADKFHCLDGAIYLYCPNGYGRTKLTNNALERLLATQATTRNWRTVTALCALASESDDV